MDIFKPNGMPKSEPEFTLGYGMRREARSKKPVHSTSRNENRRDLTPRQRVDPGWTGT